MRLSAFIGIAIGVLAWLAIASLTRARPELAHAAGRAISECDGPIRELVIHYTPDAPFAHSLYRDLLPQLPSRIKVHVVCRSFEQFRDLQSAVGPARCTLSPVIAPHEMTTWSRDRWTALTASDGRPVLYTPAEEDGAEAWPQRWGDQQIAETLAASLPSVKAMRSALLFDGGDLLCDGQTLFVTPAVVRRNVPHTAASADDVRDVLQRDLGLRAVLLEDVPDHHAGMFMMAAGARTVIVGDPSMAKQLWSSTRFTQEAGWQPDFTPETQRLFDNAAAQVEREGYHVVRIPTVPGRSSKAYVTYVNVLIDVEDGRRVVYMPVYRGADELNEMTADVWRSLGYQVRSVDCTDVYMHFGTLHCLVNVMSRDAQ